MFTGNGNFLVTSKTSETNKIARVLTFGASAVFVRLYIDIQKEVGGGRKHK